MHDYKIVLTQMKSRVYRGIEIFVKSKVRYVFSPPKPGTNDPTGSTTLAYGRLVDQLCTCAICSQSSSILHAKHTGSTTELKMLKNAAPGAFVIILCHLALSTMCSHHVLHSSRAMNLPTIPSIQSFGWWRECVQSHGCTRTGSWCISKGC